MDNTMNVGDKVLVYHTEWFMSRKELPTNMPVLCTVSIINKDNFYVDVSSDTISGAISRLPFQYSNNLVVQLGPIGKLLYL